MRRLWAPWRMEYIKKPRERDCLFCRVAKEDSDRDNLILYRSQHSYIIMNRYPYNNGHVMVVPYRHVASPEMLDVEEDVDISDLIKISIKVIRRVMNPQGFNIGANIGKAAGAGIEEHYHIHIVPRWVGDTNFMPIISDTKVVVEHILDTYNRLKEELDKYLENEDNL